MSETELIKLIIQGGFAGIAAALVILLFMALRHQFRQDEKQAEQDRAWMAMFEKVLNGVLTGQHEKFSELAQTFKTEQEEMAETFKTALGDMVQAVQKNQEAAQEQMIERMIEHMAEVTADRTARLELLDANIKTIPAEVRRILADDLAAQIDAIQEAEEQHQEIIREAVSAALQPMLSQIEDRLEQLPGEAVSRRIIREEIRSLQQQLVDQVADQITPLFDKLGEIITVLDQLQPHADSPVESGQTASDETEKDKENVATTP
jgi:hypothetical protein